MIQQGWREQYERMLRSQRHLYDVANGVEHAGSDTARDALYHCYQDAYHLKDWLKNDDAVTVDNDEIEAAVKNSRELALCADLCNGTKHRKLKGSKTGDIATAFTEQSVQIRGRTAHLPHLPQVIVAPGRASHSWLAESNGERYDAVELARLVVNAWNAWLREKRLI